MSKQLQINLTYKCNLKCPYCIQFVDKIDWKQDTEISFEDIELAKDIIAKSDAEFVQIRVSGGEPTQHPMYEECIAKLWELVVHNKFIVCTNIQELKSVPQPVKYRKSPVGWKEPRHQPPMISPTDLGIPIDLMLPIDCIIIRRCGNLFDKFGFAPCGNAAPIGRVLRIDPYSTTPVLHGNDPEMCKHCYSILTKRQRIELSAEIRAGKMEYPTKTYREGLERDKVEPFVFKTFQERLGELK